MDDPLFMRQVKTLISINDKCYLDKTLKEKKITSQNDFKKLELALKDKYDFNVAHSICKQGSIDMLEFFRSKNKDFSIDFVDDQGLNCLHHAVTKSRHAFVDHLLFKDKSSRIDVNKQSLDRGESPLFLALGKIKSDKDKLKMVQLLLKHPKVNVGLLNYERKLAFEAYSNQFGYDEAANSVEQKYLEQEAQSNKQHRAKSSVGFPDFDAQTREELMNCSKDKKKCTSLIEDHIMKHAGDLDQEAELRNLIRQSKQIQDRLKNMHQQQLFIPFSEEDENAIRKELDKKLMEFCGITIIKSLNELY